LTRSIVRFASLFLVALATGGAFVVSLLYNPDKVSPAFWIEILQLGIRNLIPLAVALNLGLLFTLISTFLARHDGSSVYLLIGASVCMLLSVLVTVLGNWPINDQIATWSVTAPPANWTELSHRWWRLHLTRAALLVVALCLVIVTTLRRRDPVTR
jgi:uncharacterized membrane protein